MANPDDVIPDAPGMQIAVRVHLAHAVVQHVAESAGIDLLHIKGPAFDVDLRPGGRTSSDVDVLVRPHHLHRLVAALESLGWEQRTGFATGSIFAHAANWWHDDWGWLDVHLSWPGVQIPDEAAFNLLAARSTSVDIAHIACPVPSRTDQILVLVLHGARSTRLEESAFAWAMADESERAAVRSAARELDAEVALAAGIGELEQFRHVRTYAIWRHLSQGGSRINEWRARWAAAPDLRARLGLVAASVRVNRDHLRMELGRPPTRADVRSRQLLRIRRATTEARARIGRGR